MLKQRGCYTIELSDGRKIPLRFCTWTFARFCEVNGNLTFSDMQKKLALDGGMTPNEVISIILCAAEYQFVRDKKPFPFEHIDASDWLDEMGGMTGKKVIEMAGVISLAFADGSDAGHEAKKKAPVKR